MDIVVGRPVEPVVVPDSIGVDAAPAVPVPQPTGLSRRPAQSFVTVTVAEPLVAGTYRVEASGMPNLRGLVGGGDANVDYVPPPPPTEVDLDDDAAADKSEDMP